MTERKQRDPQTERLVSGCVTLILLAGAVAIILSGLFVATWIVS